MRQKTPLERWAWERFQMKGSIVGMGTRLKKLSSLKFTTEHERWLLQRAAKALQETLDVWKASQRNTRKLANKKG